MMVQEIAVEDYIPKETEIPTKSSAEILDELFSSFNAKPPIIIPETSEKKVSDKESESKHDKENTHTDSVTSQERDGTEVKEEKKHKKKKKRKRKRHSSSESREAECGRKCKKRHKSHHKKRTKKKETKEDENSEKKKHRSRSKDKKEGDEARERSRSGSTEKIKRLQSGSHNQSKRSRSRSHDKAKSHKTESDDRSKRSRNSRSQGRSKRSSRSRSRDRSKRSSHSRSRDRSKRSSHSRSRERSGRSGQSKTQDESKISMSKGHDKTTGFLSRSHGRSKRSRSKSQDKYDRSRSKSQDKASRSRPESQDKTRRLQLESQDKLERSKSHNHEKATGTFSEDKGKKPELKCRDKAKVISEKESSKKQFHSSSSGTEKVKCEKEDIEVASVKEEEISAKKLAQVQEEEPKDKPTMASVADDVKTGDDKQPTASKDKSKETEIIDKPKAEVETVLTKRFLEDSIHTVVTQVTKGSTEAEKEESKESEKCRTENLIRTESEDPAEKKIKDKHQIKKHLRKRSLSSSSQSGNESEVYKTASKQEKSKDQHDRKKAARNHKSKTERSDIVEASESKTVRNASLKDEKRKVNSKEISKSSDPVKVRQVSIDTCSGISLPEEKSASFLLENISSIKIQVKNEKASGRSKSSKKAESFRKASMSVGMKEVEKKENMLQNKSDGNKDIQKTNKKEVKSPSAVIDTVEKQKEIGASFENDDKAKQMDINVKDEALAVNREGGQPGQKDDSKFEEQPLLAGGRIAETKPKKIVIKDLKHSAVFQQTVKEVEEKAREKAEKYEEGELASDSESSKSQSGSEDGKKAGQRQAEVDTDDDGEIKEDVKKPKKRKSKHEDKRKRDKSRKHSREERRGKTKRKRNSRSHSRSRSKSKTRHRNSRSHSRSRSKSRTRQRRRSWSRTPPRKRSPLDLREKIDKKKLLEIARRNAMKMLDKGTLPPGVDHEKLLQLKAGGKSVEELTDFCKQLSKKEASGFRSSDDAVSDKSDGEDNPFIAHPFQIKERPSSIVMNIRNAVQLPIKTPQEKQAEQAKLRIQFPVSSGNAHRSKESELIGEWVPVSPQMKEQEEKGKKEENKEKVEKAEKIMEETAKVTSVSSSPSEENSNSVPEKDKVFPDIPTTAVNLDIGSIVSQRLSAMRKLQENPDDVEALGSMFKSQKDMETWAASKQQPGQFTGSTGAKILTQAELTAGYQAWAKKDQFKEAAPVQGGMGQLLLQKMGWKPGEGLGRNKEGTVEPLQLEIKFDKKGLTSQDEMVKKTPSMPPVKDLSGKHPVSALTELCTKKRWAPPQFELSFECGPAHKKQFLYKVKVNGQLHKASVASNNKKLAKAQAAAVCLQALGLIPRHQNNPS